MKRETLRRIAGVAACAAIAAGLAALILFTVAWRGRGGSPAVTAAATTVMIATLVLPLAYVFVQLLPGGRAPVSLPGVGPDAWAFILVCTMIPGAFWQTLAELAVPPMRYVMPGYFTPPIAILLLVLARMVQQRRGAS